MFDHNPDHSRPMKMSSIFDNNLKDGIDAALVITNPIYDGFGQFDVLYLFKGQTSSILTHK